MNSTAFGNKLEKSIFNLFREEIEQGRFFAKPECCKLHQKKGYYSKDRQSDIIFDVSIEIYLPGASEYSMLVLIECKNSTGTIQVDDVEEFFSKTQQISGGNIKGVVASTNSFQRGALNFAQAKGFGLLRYYDRSNFQWILKRSPSFNTQASDVASSVAAEIALQDESYKSQYFDFYALSIYRFTTSLWDFFDDFTASSDLTQEDLSVISNRRNRTIVRVPFIGKDDIEALATKVHGQIGYTRGTVSLDAVCDLEHAACGLRVINDDSHLIEPNSNDMLGSISFSPLEIRLYTQQSRHSGRERFTLAHELAHHLLGHCKYITAEYCRAVDLASNATPNLESSDIARMEWQANYFASCLLLPWYNLASNFFGILKDLQLPDKGFGPLYVDNQRINLDNYYAIIDLLKAHYNVSRTAIKIRLEGLGLLNDARGSTSINQLVDQITDG